MPIDFYYFPASPPSRSARLVAAALGVELNLINIDIMSGEQFNPEFLKMNPMHCVPLINDDGFTLYESPAICCYLADQYGADDSLYPKDPKSRGLVNQRIFFNLGTLYAAFKDYYFPQLFFGAPADPDKVANIDKAFEYLNQFLEGQNYVAGENLTIADLIILSTVTTYEAAEYDFSNYDNVVNWLERLKSEATEYEEANGKGAEEFKKIVEHALKKQ